MDADVFWDGYNATILEMNARLGGGYPFSHIAGANLPKAYIDWTRGKIPKHEDLSVLSGVKGFKGFTMIEAKKTNILNV